MRLLFGLLGLLPLVFRIHGPAPVSYERTALGRATHRMRVVLTNDGTRAARLSPLALSFAPIRNSIAYPCDAPWGDARLPATIEPGASVVIERTVTCETPLPGRYDVEVRANGRLVGRTAIEIGAGRNAPVQHPSEPRLHVAADTTRDLRPGDKGRVVVAVTNTSRSEVPLAPATVIVRVVRRGSSAPACPPETIDLDFHGSLAPGRSVALGRPLTCALAEGAHDVEVTLATTAGPVHLASHVVRASVIPVPHPGPTGTLPADMTP